MRISVFTASAATLLAGCAPDNSDLAVTADYRDIVEKALLIQPDGAREYRDYIADHPEGEGILSRFADHRICVARETAGDGRDFIQFDNSGESIPLGYQSHRVRWERSTARQKIPKDILPSHLRWDSIFAVCPSGVIRLGNPVIEGNRARVYIDNWCSGWCGSNGEILLKREEGAWIFERRNFWSYN